MYSRVHSLSKLSVHKNHLESMLKMLFPSPLRSAQYSDPGRMRWSLEIRIFKCTQVGLLKPHSEKSAGMLRIIETSSLISTSLRVGYLHKASRILLHGRFLSSLLLMYLFSNLSTAVWTHEHLFCILGYNLKLLDLLSYSDCCSFGH